MQSQPICRPRASDWLTPPAIDKCAPISGRFSFLEAIATCCVGGARSAPPTERFYMKRPRKRGFRGRDARAVALQRRARRRDAPACPRRESADTDVVRRLVDIVILSRAILRCAILCWVLGCVTAASAQTPPSLAPPSPDEAAIGGQPPEPAKPSATAT